MKQLTGKKKTINTTTSKTSKRINSTEGLELTAKDIWKICLILELKSYMNENPEVPLTVEVIISLIEKL